MMMLFIICVVLVTRGIATKGIQPNAATSKVWWQMHCIPGQPELYGGNPEILHSLLKGGFALLLIHSILAGSLGTVSPRAKVAHLLLSCLLVSQWAIFVLNFLPINALSMNLWGQGLGLLRVQVTRKIQVILVPTDQVRPMYSPNCRKKNWLLRPVLLSLTWNQRKAFSI